MTIPEIRREFRAAWVATVGNIDWPSSRRLGTARQKAELAGILDRAKELKLNAVILQIRPQSDALYASAIEPWSEYLTGRMGRAPDPPYDPLEYAVAEAHARGLELHAWLNPYRALVNRRTAAASAQHISLARPALVRPYGNSLWADPGEPEVQEYLLGLIRDVAARYDLDGIHFDDYFYPYPDERSTPFPDDVSWNKYTASGGRLGRADWRRRNVDEFVRRASAAVRETRPAAKFGVSPFGIWRGDNPPGTRGLSAYDELYADSRKWLREGWVDYLTPQLYWRIAEPRHGYKSLLDWWVSQNTAGRHVWPGNAVSEINNVTHPVSEILEQIRLTRESSPAPGNVHFSMSAFLKDRDGINAALKAGPYKEPALVPACPWLGRTAPERPRVTVAGREDGGAEVAWEGQGAKQPFLWVVYAQRGDAWEVLVQPSAVKNCSLGPGAGAVSAVAVSAVDRLGNESQRAEARV